MCIEGGSVLLQDEQPDSKASTTIIDMDGIARDNHPANHLQLYDEQVQIVTTLSRCKYFGCVKL